MRLIWECVWGWTSRERHKSAPYLRLIQSVKYSLLQYPKNPKIGPNWLALSDFLTTIMLQNVKNIEGDPLKTLKNFRKKSHNAETWLKSVSGGRSFSIICWIKIFENPKKFRSTENLTLNLYMGQKLCEIFGKWRHYIRTLKISHPNFETVLSEFMNVLDVMYVLKKVFWKWNKL